MLHKSSNRLNVYNWILHIKKYLTIAFGILVVLSASGCYYVYQRPAVAVREIAIQETGLTPGIKRYIQEIKNTQAQDAPAPSGKEVRVLCLILTVEETFWTHGSVVNATWAKRCDKYFFVFNTNINSPDIIRTPFTETRNNIVYKVIHALNYIYNNHIDDFDWLLKTDDDTYVIIENLKYLLRKQDSSKPGYLGFHFNKFVASGYMSGGAGYAISNRGLRFLIEFGFNAHACPIKDNIDDPENSEDIEIGRCLNTSGVPVIDSLDETGRERFHPYPIDKHLLGSVEQYVHEWAKHPHREGLECCSKYSISFHYMDPKSMLLVDHLLYRMSVYGRNEKEGT